MGGNNSKTIIEAAFQSSNSNFNNSKLIKEEDESYIQAKFQLQNKQYDEWKESFDRILPQKSSYLFLPTKSAFMHDKGLCGTTGTLINNYPYFPYTLQEEILGRKQTDKPSYLRQSDLWYLLFAVVSAKQQMAFYNHPVGDIKPDNVFISPQHGVKLANLFSFPNEKNNYSKIIDIESSQKNALLAPEDFDCLSKGFLNNSANLHSEEFAIGATIMSAGLLQNMAQHFYNYNNHIFNQNAYKQKLAEWIAHPRYSEILKSIVLNLCDLDPRKRLPSKDLKAWINKYETSILDREQFIISKAPSQIEYHFGVMKTKPPK